MDGTVWAWGDNNYGQLGDGTFSDRLRPVKVLTLAGIVQVSAGGAHSMAVRSDGVAFGWGNNSSAALGDGTYNSRTVPGQVTVLSAVTQVAAGGGGFTVALSNGRPYWWGAMCRQVDQEIVTCNIGSTVANPVGLTDIARIAAGTWHGVAIRSDGMLWSWGSNLFGQLGNGTTAHSHVPVPVFAAGGSVQMDAGANHTVVVVERPVVIGS